VANLNSSHLTHYGTTVHAEAHFDRNLLNPDTVQVERIIGNRIIDITRGTWLADDITSQRDKRGPCTERNTALEKVGSVSVALPCYRDAERTGRKWLHFEH
jgi:hypothetical protein